MAAAASEPGAAAETKVEPGPTLLYSVLVGQRVFIWRTIRRKFFPATVVRAWTSAKARAVGSPHTRACWPCCRSPFFLFLTPPPLSVCQTSFPLAPVHTPVPVWAQRVSSPLPGRQ
jgi:hypothetical protein